MPTAIHKLLAVLAACISLADGAAGADPTVHGTSRDAIACEAPRSPAVGGADPAPVLSIGVRDSLPSASQRDYRIGLRRGDRPDRANPDPRAVDALLTLLPYSANSLLVSDGRKLVRGAVRMDGRVFDVVADAEGDGPPVPLFSMTSGRSRTPRMVGVSLHLGPDGDRPRSARRCLSALEILYADVLRMEPDSRFVVAGGPWGRLGSSQSQSSMLQWILATREAVRKQLARIGADPGAVEWKQAVMVRVGSPGARPAPERVAVRIAAAGQPVANAHVTFSSGEHLGCSTVSGTDGVAMCELYDSHGHEVPHEEHGTVLTVSFGGVLEGASIHPPFVEQFPWRRHPVRARTRRAVDAQGGDPTRRRFP